MFSEQYNYGCEKLARGGGKGGGEGEGGFSSQANSIFYSIVTFPGQTNFIDGRRLIVKKRLHLYLEFAECEFLLQILRNTFQKIFHTSPF